MNDLRVDLCLQKCVAGRSLTIRLSNERMDEGHQPEKIWIIGVEVFFARDIVGLHHQS